MNGDVDISRLRKELEGLRGREYWRSLDELAGTPEFQQFLDKEFPRQAATVDASIDRRDFVKLLGASLAFAGLTACVRPPDPPDRIVPYVRQPESVVPGKPLHFATALTDQGFAHGVVVESHLGRPTKIEGNEEHPASLGATDARMQATVLQLYDPDRSQSILAGGEESSWEAFAASVGENLADLPDGTRLRLLTGPVTSPTLAMQIRELLETYPGARWHRHEPLEKDLARQASQQAFGQHVVPRYHLENAQVIVSLAGDILGSGPAKVRHTKEFARNRRVRTAGDDMNRLYAIESGVTLTGAMADHRLPLKPSAMEAAARQLAARLGLEVAVGDEVVGADWLDAVVSDLEEHQGASLIVAGEGQPVAVQALVHAMNDALGNVGETVTYHEPVASSDAEDVATLSDLVNDMAAGEVDVLVMLGVNPAYDAAADLDFAASLAQVQTSIHVGLYHDETGAASTWHVPLAHELETWGDGRAFDGTLSIQQPLIAPLYGGLSALELLSALRGEPERTAFEIVRDAYQEAATVDFDTFWRDALYRGTVEGMEAREVSVSLRPEVFDAPVEPMSDTLELLLVADPYLGYGEFANSGWLQELPRPFTKLTWDNALLVAPSTAERFELATGDIVTVRAAGREVNAPVWILPGQAADSLALNLGYGRDRAGRIGDGVGVNGFRLYRADAAWIDDVQLARTGRRAKLASTQLHHAIDTDGLENRHLIRSATLAEFREDPEHPDFVHPMPHHDSDLYPDWDYPGYKWGMLIDQSVCTGCNACVVACQAENNIPIVGKDQVAVGREMHWLRIDTYHRGSLDNPEYVYQPMPCQHCEKAPCEPVCPVAATVHDHEGLNVMVYNRCVGTRYCSNNCPFKVRRFNYLQYAELQENMLSMVQNPDVTVRSRGVIEKCTYCTQRINRARVEAENESRRIRDGDLQTACQQACPAEAIVFGDLNDEESRVLADKASPLNHTLLEDLNLFPRTSYLAKITNPHPALAPGRGEA